MRNLVCLLFIAALAVTSLACSTPELKDKYIGHSVGDDRVIATIIYWPQDETYEEVKERFDKRDEIEMPQDGPPAWLEIRFRDIEPLLEHKRIALRHGVNIKGGKEYLLTHALMIDIINNDIGPAFVQYVENYGQVEEMKRRMGYAVEQLENGVPFQTVAEQYSDDLGTKEVGGRLADSGPDDMYHPLTQIAFSMEDDEWRAYEDPDTLEPLASIYGFHIIKRFQYFPANGLFPPRVGLSHILFKYNNITETQNFSNIYKNVRKRVLYKRGWTHGPAIIDYSEPALLAQDALSKDNKDWREGIKYLRGAQISDPDNLLVDVKLAEVYVQLGFLDQGIEILLDAVERIERGDYREEYNVMIPGLYLRLTRYYLANNDEAEFLKYLEKCYESYSEAVENNDFSDPDLWDSVQLLYRRMGLEDPVDPVTKVTSPDLAELDEMPLPTEDNPRARR